MSTLFSSFSEIFAEKIQTPADTDLKLAPFPIDSCAPAHFDLSVCPSMSLAAPRLHSLAAALVALPSISLFPSARFTDDLEVRDQPSIGANSRFSRKCNGVVTIWRALSTGQVRPGGEHAKNKKKCTISALACSRVFLAHETHE